ncbi:hypothetical protein [Streptomyces chartreusis]|uniref:hypothetical protein n=1 Tax=Streptomyces chartreusis TaxID=1969 RepID=UPI002E19A18B
MIVTTAGQPARTYRDGSAHMSGRSLARRGFLFSETEAVDHFRLTSGAEIGPRGRTGTEEVWFVAEGSGHLRRADGTTSPLRGGALAVCCLGSGTHLCAGPGGMDLVLVAVVPRHLTAGMPPRLPVAS